MPLDQVKVVLTVTDPAVRDEVIAEHLRSMERQLEQTKTAVASLRRLLEGGGPPSLDFAFQTFTSTPALLVSARVAWDETFVWLRDTLVDLRREIGSDAALLGGFWAQALGDELDPGAGKQFASIGLHDSRRTSTRWCFAQLPEGKSTKNQMHPDLITEDLEAEVERPVGLGATWKANAPKSGSCTFWGPAPRPARQRAPPPGAPHPISSVVSGIGGLRCRWEGGLFGAVSGVREGAAGALPTHPPRFQRCSAALATLCSASSGR